MPRVRGMPGNSAQNLEKPKMNKFARVFRSPRAALASVALAASGASHAALDSAITTSLSTAQADGITLGGLVLAAIIAIWAFKLIRRAL